MTGAFNVWVYEANLRPFLTVLGWVVGYSFDADDWAAISFGVRETDAGQDRWFGYEFVGRDRAVLRLGIDPGTAVVHVDVAVRPELGPQVRLAADIFAHFRVHSGP